MLREVLEIIRRFGSPLVVVEKPRVLGAADVMVADSQNEGDELTELLAECSVFSEKPVPAHRTGGHAVVVN